MPDVRAYLRGFGLQRGLRLDGYVLRKVDAAHEAIVRNQQYAYTIRMQFDYVGPQPPDVGALVEDLARQGSGTRVIRSSYGNPYACTFGPAQVESHTPQGEVVLMAQGTSHRV